MFEINITSALLDEIEGYMASSNCHLVDGMVKDGLSAEAILFVLQSVVDRANEIRIAMLEDEEDENNDN